MLNVQPSTPPGQENLRTPGYAERTEGFVHMLEHECLLGEPGIAFALGEDRCTAVRDVLHALIQKLETDLFTTLDDDTIAVLLSHEIDGQDEAEIGDESVGRSLRRVI